MPELPPKALEMTNLSPKARRIGWAAAALIRLFSLTFRWRLHDRSGITEVEPEKPMIWIFWHNRIFALPTAYKKYMSSRKGAILTSASNDGAIIAATVARFGCSAVRGSSSRRGATAFLGLLGWLKDGFDIAIVPDGPRGPRYRLGPGVVKLAGMTDALILPIRLEYRSKWVFKSWDRFQLPKPFSVVDVYFEPCESIPAELDDAAFELERQRIEKILNPNDETD